MVNKALFKLYGNIEYNTLARLPLVTGITYGGFIASSKYVIEENPTVGLGINLLSSLFLYGSYMCYKTKGKMYSKEIKELRELYDSVLENYQLVNEIFRLENPVEIYTMFKEVLKGGYLSVDKEFKYKESQIKDLETLYEIIPITGEGVCRHIAPMLRDVLKKEKIKSNVMIVEFQKRTSEQIKQEIRTKIETAFKDEPEEIIEEMIKYYERIEKLEKCIKEHISSEYHAITLAVQDGKVHLLDATQDRIYKVNPNNKNCIMDESSDDIEIKINQQIFIGTRKDLENQKDQILLPSTNYEDDINKKIEIEKMFKENKDVFEKLYRENHDLYEEINQKVLKFKR